jgi:cytochrome c oxidase subunit 1
MIVSIPSVVVGTSLLLTLWGGSIRFTPPMLFALAFLPLFALGGLTGLPLGMAASDVHLHDTLYVVGHFHLMVGPGTLFALFAAFYHWMPRWTGRMPSRLLAHLHFWPSLLGMLSVFTHMLLQGLAGVPRRYWDGGVLFERWQNQTGLHHAATDGAYLLALAQVPFLINLLWTPLRGLKAADPWDVVAQGESPEWAPADSLGTRRQPTRFGDRELGLALAAAALVMFLAALASAWIFLRVAGGA